MKINYILLVLMLLMTTINVNSKQHFRSYVSEENIKYDEWKQLLLEMEEMKSLTPKDFLKYRKLKGLNTEDKEVVEKIESAKLKLFNEFIKERIPENILEKIKDERAEKKLKYNFVEIEECTIPISKIYIEEQEGNSEQYEYKFIYPKKENFGRVVVNKRFYGDKNTIMKEVNKNTSLEVKKKTRKNYFDIIEIKSYNHNSKIYVLFGNKSIITFVNKNADELNYLLEYCQRTWKINSQKVHKKTGLSPPKVLYLALEEKYVKQALQTSVSAPEGQLLQLSKTTSEALKLENDKENLHLLKIDSAQMYKDDVAFGKDASGEWFTQTIDAKYITLLI